MARKKGPRKHLLLECLFCRSNNNKKKERNVCRYLTSKNKKNTQKKLELKKYCKFCKTHMTFKEIK